MRNKGAPSVVCKSKTQNGDYEMKRHLPILLCATFAGTVLFLAACRSELSPAVDSDTESESVQIEPLPSVETDYDIEGIVFRFGSKLFDITERNPSVNALMACIPVGKHLVIEGHVGPKNAVYCIFNTETETFEKDIAGVNLIWRGDDITTAVYSFWEGIYTYDGELIARISLEQPMEYIRELVFVSETELLIRVANENGDRTETVSLPAVYAE